MVGAGQETWNYKYEEVHIEWPARLARAIKEAGPRVERVVHMRCGAVRWGCGLGEVGGWVQVAPLLPKEPAVRIAAFFISLAHKPLWFWLQFILAWLLTCTPCPAPSPPTAPHRPLLQLPGCGARRPLPPPAHQGCGGGCDPQRAGPPLHHLQALCGDGHRGPPVQHVCNHGQAHARHAAHRRRQHAHAAGVGARRRGRWARRGVAAGGVQGGGFGRQGGEWGWHTVAPA